MLKKVLKYIQPKYKIHKNYNKFIGWNFLSNIVCSSQSVLSTHSMLETVGSASTLNVTTMNYVGKDIIGQIGSIYFLNKFGNYIDKDTKKVVTLCHILQQSSMYLECCSPLIGIDYFIISAGFANISKNISFTGFGAINTKIIGKLALEDNMGEIYTKITMLNTISSTLGMGVGLFICKLLPDSYSRVCILPLFSIIRVYTYKKSIENFL